jgi:hypothetical protein
MVYVIRSFWKSGSNFMLEKQRERERQQLKEENGRATLVEEKKKERIPATLEILIICVGHTMA